MWFRVMRDHLIQSCGRLYNILFYAVSQLRNVGVATPKCHSMHAYHLQYSPKCITGVQDLLAHVFNVSLEAEAKLGLRHECPPTVVRSPHLFGQ